MEVRSPNGTATGKLRLGFGFEERQDWTMPLSFEWDQNKAKINLATHGVAFEEAATVFGDSLSLTIPDPVHSQVEHRWIVVGQSHQSRLLVVVHTERGDNIRIISARLASRRERKQYEEST